MQGHLGAVSLKKSHDIVILSFCNIVKGPANSQITQVITPVILTNSSYNSSYLRITRDSDRTIMH